MTDRPPLLPSYPEYKPSGIPWLGDIPAHWEVPRLKYLCSRTGIYGANVPATEYQDTGIRFIRTTDITDDGRLKDDDGVFLPKELVDNYLLDDGDVLISRSGTVGRSFLYQSKLHGPCAYAGYLVRFVSGPRLLPEYLFLFTQTQAFQWFIRSVVIKSTIENVNAKKYSNAHIPLPPPEEQAAIARYLIHKDALIQRFLQGKQRMLDLLKQLRKSTIHYAVIHGLDPKNTPMKPSGIPWIDEIPAHWQTIPLKFWVRINQAVLPENTDPNYEFRYIDIGSIGTGVRVEEPEKMRFATAPSRARRIVRNGDTIFSTVRTYLKAVWFADDPGDDLICSTGFAVFTPRQNSSPKFVSYVAQSDAFINRVTANSVGVTYPAISKSRLGSLRIPVPPLEEQEAIAEYLDDKIPKIDAAIAVTIRIIDQMRQYRKSLIHEVVTGVRDVRKAAAAIPADPSPPDPPAP